MLNRRRLLFTIPTVTLPCFRTASGQASDFIEDRIDTAVQNALLWLSREQSASGSWVTKDFGPSTATTALAVMAFLAAGHTPDEGPYGRVISRGIAWVLSQQNKNGLLVSKRSSHGPMYSHGIATLMLAEVCGMVSGAMADRVRIALEKAARLIVNAQNVLKQGLHEGGWRYQPTSADSDLSVTAWQLLALRAAKDIGCDIPSRNIDRAVSYIKRLRVKRDGGFGYMSPTGSTVTRTGTGIVALEVCGEHRTAETMAAARQILSRPLNRQQDYFYYGAYYCTVGMYKVGGEEWRSARTVLYETILKEQTAVGYWKPIKGSEERAGNVYATSLSLLALCIEYGYLPIYQR